MGELYVLLSTYYVCSMLPIYVLNTRIGIAKTAPMIIIFFPKIYIEELVLFIIQWVYVVVDIFWILT